MDYGKLINRKIVNSKKQLLWLENAIEIYRDYYQNKKFYIELSNGETICVELTDSCLPQLLGFKKQYKFYKEILKSCDLSIKKFDLYTFINCLVNNMDKVATTLYDKHIDREFLKKVGERSYAFSEYENLENVNYVVCKKDLDKVVSDIVHIRSNYFIIIENSNTEFNFNSMGINVEKEKSYVETMFFFRDDNINFQNQVMTIPKKITTVTDDKEFTKSLSIQSQIRLLKKYATVIRNNDMFVDLSASEELVEEAEKMKIKII